MCYQVAFQASRKRMLLPARLIQPIHKVLFAAVVQAILRCKCTSCLCMLVLVCISMEWHLLVYGSSLMPLLVLLSCTEQACAF
jgi:hypothetical protein